MHLRERAKDKTEAGRVAKVKIRWLDIEKHLTSVVRIERASFDYPWTPDEFKIYKNSRTTSSVVAVDGAKVVGYMFYELHKNHIQLINLAISPSDRRTGIASGLLLRLISKMSPDRRNMITTQIRESNLAAQLFFRASGFISSKIIGQCFDGTDESAYEMVFRHGWPVEIESSIS